MRFFKRLSVSVQSALDQAISQFENHEAIIDSALQESRGAIARLKVQHTQLQRELRDMDRQLEQLAQDRMTWLARAKSSANGDEAQAIACLERRDRCDEQADQLRQQREQAAALAFRLDKKITKLERKLVADQQRLREYRGRDLVNAGEGGVNWAGADSTDLDQAFAQWDVEITDKELRHRAVDVEGPERDPLEERLVREERFASYRAELKAMQEDAS